MSEFILHIFITLVFFAGLIMGYLIKDNEIRRY